MGSTNPATIPKMPRSMTTIMVVPRIGMVVVVAIMKEDIVMKIAAAINISSNSNSNNRMSETTTCGSLTCVITYPKNVISHPRGSAGPGLGSAGR